MRGEQAMFNLEIKKKSGLSINPDIHHSKVFSSDQVGILINQSLILFFSLYLLWSSIDTNQSVTNPILVLMSALIKFEY